MEDGGERLCGEDYDQIELGGPFGLAADEVFNLQDLSLVLSLNPVCSSCTVYRRRCSQSSQKPNGLCVTVTGARERPAGGEKLSAMQR